MSVALSLKMTYLSYHKLRILGGCYIYCVECHGSLNTIYLGSPKDWDTKLFVGHNIVAIRY